MLGVLALLIHGVHRPLPILIAVATVAVKGLVIPAMLRRAMREAAIRREVEPLIDFIPSLLACAAATGLAIIFAGTLPLAPQHEGSLLVPASLSTVLAGFIVLASRRKAITQVRVIILENSISSWGSGCSTPSPSSSRPASCSTSSWASSSWE